MKLFYFFLIIITISHQDQYKEATLELNRKTEGELHNKTVHKYNVISCDHIMIIIETKGTIMLEAG